MANSDTQTVARLLREYAQRTSLRGGNPYRAKAFLRAADSLSALSQPLDRAIAAGTLTEIPGVGDAIADIVTKLIRRDRTQASKSFARKCRLPSLNYFTVPGLRPDKILRLYQELGITSLAGLEAAAKEDRVRKVKGLGAALQTKILQNLSIARNSETQLHLHKAAALLQHAVSEVKREHPEFSHVKIAGDFRRGCKLVSSLAVVAQAKTVSSGHGSSGGLNLIVTDKKHFGAFLLNATGSPAHLELLQEFARHKGFDLKPDGLYRDMKLVASATEEEISAGPAIYRARAARRPERDK
jgi:DNA polymerase (family X)